MEVNTQREVAALQICETHPNIVKLHDVHHDQVRSLVLGEERSRETLTWLRMKGLDPEIWRDPN